MAVDVLIFDCDGVLIDSETLVCGIAADELTELGYAITTEQVIARFAGRPDHEMRAEIARDWGRSIPDSYRENVNARTYQAYGTELKIMPGVKDALDEITLPVCVASSSFPEKLQLGLQTVGLFDRFAPNIVSATLVAHGKPKPDIFLFAAGWMKASPFAMSCHRRQRSRSDRRQKCRIEGTRFRWWGALWSRSRRQIDCSWSLRNLLRDARVAIVSRQRLGKQSLQRGIVRHQQPAVFPATCRPVCCRQCESLACV